MQIEQIEQWVGRDVVDSEGETVGKLEEVYYRGEEPVLAEVKTGLLARKRLLVPLTGTSVTRDFIQIGYAQDRLLHEESGGAGFDAKDLTAVAEHYGAGCSYQTDELESSRDRTDRLAAAEQARQHAVELEDAARQRAEETRTTAQRAEQAAIDARTAEQAQSAAEAEAAAARAAAERR